MIIERSMHRGYLSNAYLVADGPGGHGVLIDTGAPAEPLLEAIDENGLTITHVLCTHHHGDHVSNNELFRERFGCPVCAHPEEAERLRNGDVDVRLEDGAVVESGDLRIEAILTPGHTLGMLAFVVDDEAVFTGDTLFRRGVGGTVAPGHASFEELRRSIMDVLMELPDGMTAYPGHTDETTIGEEWEENAFIRMWRGLDEPREVPCRALGRSATLLLRGPDYDGGTKCWVRWDGGGLDIVPGSRTEEE